jgi:hypothetical protein
VRPLFLSALVVTQLIFVSDLIGGKLCDSTGLTPFARVGHSDLATASAPNTQVCTHNRNNMLLSVTNFGCFGSQAGAYPDCETGEKAHSCEFPAGSRSNYLAVAGLWVGAVVDYDTVVSTAFGSRPIPGG